MSERVVVLFLGDDEGLEIAPLDADALAGSKMIRVSFGRYGGALADATVCYPHKKLLGRHMENASREDFGRAKATILRLCASAKQVPGWSPE